jgi:hypothetical protein
MNEPKRLSAKGQINNQIERNSGIDYKTAYVALIDAYVHTRRMHNKEGCDYGERQEKI